jgi:ligand-binding sensor domain-containing protein
MSRTVLIPAMLVMLISMSVRGQQISFTSYNSAQGLSQNSGYCITQDAKGYIWMGTQDGLNKFNGRKITNYYKETIKRGSLTSNHIRSLFFDSLQNWLWIGTDKGLTIYDITSDSFYRASYYFPGADTLGGLMISNITGIGENKIAVCTFSEGVFICNNITRKVKQFLQQPLTKNRTRAIINWQNALLAVANGRLYKITDSAKMVGPAIDMGDVRNMLVWQNSLWVASTNKGLFKITGIKDFTPVPVDCSSLSIGTLITDRQNNLWVGSRDKGLIIMEPRTFKVTHSFETAANQNEWPGKFSLSLFRDRQGNIWIGSSGKGFSMATISENIFSLIQKREDLKGKAAHNMILSICGPVNNIIYFGTQLKGLRAYNTKTKELQDYPLGNSTASNVVNGITASTSNDIWLATDAGLYHFNSNSKKTVHYIDSNFATSLQGQSVFKLNGFDTLLFSSTNNILLFDIKNKKFRYLDLANETVHKTLAIFSIYQDKEGKIWIGSYGHGLVMYSFKAKAFRIFDKVQPITATVYNIKEKNGIFWIAGPDGLIVYDMAKDSIIKILNSANGLPVNVIYSIEQDNENNFWCSSNAGLFKINSSTYSVTHVPAAAGLQGDEFNKASSTKDSTGNLFFGGINGVSFFNPARFSASAFSPAPEIESVKILNKEIWLPKNILYTDEIKFSYNENFISFEFGVTNFTNNDECTFRYKLDEVNRDWVFNSTRNYVNFTNLQPGKYVFLLQSANSEGIWSDKITRLRFVIARAWWQTFLFKFLYLLTAFSIFTIVIRKRIQHIRKNAALKQHITETEIAALKAQMNPHFIFNCINSIDAFIHSNDKYNATLYLNKFAKLLRNILDSSKQNTVAFTKDFETLKLYVELEELRHENKFKTIINIEEELLSNDYKVPPLIIQPFVENAILHGLKNREDNEGLLLIEIKKLADKIEYTIKDNGIGRNASGLIVQNKEASYGMQMSNDRIKLFNKEEIPSVQINDLYFDEKATGTEVKVRLNII